MVDPNHQEAEALIGIGRSMALSRPDMSATSEKVLALVEAALDFDSPIKVEQGFENAARLLRAGWLKSVAAETSRVLRSPTEREIERLSRSRHDAYGYERDFQPESLEARCEAFFGPAPIGWSTAHIIFSSGQAALASVLLHLAEHHPRKLRVAHVGSYFETRELVERCCNFSPGADDADCVIVEPVACDGRFSTHDPATMVARLTRGQTLVVDETLTAPETRAPSFLSGDAVQGVAVLRIVSGLKLLQQGLELANVGIVTVFAKESDLASSLADGLKRCRTLCGAGLRFVDALALEAPFFLDGPDTTLYADRVFAHNRSLARAVMAENRVFKPLGEAGLFDIAAPYCALELACGNSVEALEALGRVIDREARGRGLLIERGGSFGFRGHRYEVIEPDSGEEPFLRVALGARDDRSRRGIIEVMSEFACGSTPGCR